MQYTACALRQGTQQVSRPPAPCARTLLTLPLLCPRPCREVFNELPLEFAAEVNELMSLKLEGSVG